MNKPSPGAMQPIYSVEEIRESAGKVEYLDLLEVIEKDDFKFLYRPNDDTFFLLDTIEHDLKNLYDNLASDRLNIVTEIG